MSGGTGQAAFAAIDLGASGGRVMVGVVGPGRVELVEAARFANGGVWLPDGAGGSLHWDVLRLWRDVVAGLRAAASTASTLSAGAAPLAGVAVDSWGIDYGLLDEQGRLLANPHHYRDRRTDGVAGRVHAELPAADAYRLNGLQHLPFTTVYQLAAEPPGRLAAAARLLLIPDLFGYWLSGHQGSELTNASTTGLLDVTSRTWSRPLLDAAGVPERLLAPRHGPGSVLGALRPEVLAETGLPAGVELSAVGSHDTASAVVGVPAEGESFAFISCGTWGLVGVELEHPVLSDDSRLANFTNEFGVDGTTRYLCNVMGLWLLQECLRVWRARGEPHALDTLLVAAGSVPPGGPVIDVDDPVFLPPGDMPARVSDACRRAGLAPPADHPRTVRCILDSLAAAFARAVEDAARLSGRAVEVVHLVGGGARNDLLCRLTADACGRPVLAGPVEATALGNVLVQARTHGLARGDLASLRARVRASVRLRRYEPAAGRAWQGG